MTVLQNICFPMEIQRIPKKERIRRAEELAEMVHITPYLKRKPAELSGGQQQRVAIARALANNPAIMLCDEATSALDTRSTVSILKLLADINRDLGVTMVVITHSLAVAQKVCNRIAVIDGGRIVEEGLTAEVFANPQSPVTRELIENDSLSGDLAAWKEPEPSEGNRLDDPATGSLELVDAPGNPAVRLDRQGR